MSSCESGLQSEETDTENKAQSKDGHGSTTSDFPYFTSFIQLSFSVCWTQHTAFRWCLLMRLAKLLLPEHEGNVRGKLWHRPELL